MGRTLPFLLEHGSGEVTETIGGFQTLTESNTFDATFESTYEDMNQFSFNIMKDTNKLIDNPEIYSQYKESLLKPLVAFCEDKNFDDHGRVASYASEVGQMFDNMYGELIKESQTVGQLIPIKMIDFPLIMKEHLKVASKDILQSEVTTQPIIKKQIQRTWVVDPKQKNKICQYPQCFYSKEWREIFDAGKGYKIKDTPVDLPIVDYDIIANLTDVSVPEREKLSLNTKVVKLVTKEGDTFPWELRINLSDGSFLGGQIDQKIKMDSGEVKPVKARISGHYEPFSGTVTLSDATGNIKSVVFGGYLSNELNERYVTFDYSREEREWKIEDGHRVNIPYSIEDLEDSRALLQLDLYKLSYSNLSEYLVQMEDNDCLDYLDKKFVEYEGIEVDPLDFTPWVKHQEFDCESNYATTALPSEYIENMLKFLIDRFVIDIADTAKMEDLTFVIYGNPRYISLLGDNVKWVISNGSSVGGVKMNYNYGIMNSGGVKIQVVSTIKVMADDPNHKGLRIIPFPTKKDQMTYKHWKYTTHILTNANSGYRDPNRPGGSYTNIVGVSRYINADLQGIQGDIKLINVDKYVKL